ncbi:hypothetical protein pdam_00024357, partial [Pocillopora damicornis]
MQIVSAHQAISPSAHQATNMLLLQEEGHLISSCFEKWRVAQKQNSVEPKPNGFISKPLPLYDQLAKLHIDDLSVGESIIPPVTSVRNLGSWFDQNLSMIPHITKICRAASFHIYNIRRIRKYLKSFLIAAPALWNSLPASVRDIDNFLVFKRTIKTYLF